MASTRPINPLSKTAGPIEEPSIVSPANGNALQGKAIGRHYGVLRNKPASPDLPWIQVAPHAPYFITESGQAWTPIGQNDAITWPDFASAFRRKDVQQVENHLAWLASHGVSCLRFMLEYAQVQHRYIEQPVGKFPPNMVRLWDDLFALFVKYKIRVLLTPFDTFWMWIRWKHHPYNQANGGPCQSRSHWLLCTDTLKAIKNRLLFATERWGGSGVIFAWDLWNEIHPAHADGRTEVFDEFIQEISDHLRAAERSLYGRTHLQTVSLYGPVLDSHPQVADVIFRHPALDFASTHFYDSETINNPKDTVASAISTGRLVREALQHLPASRPFFDSEHGPIHAFKDRHITLPEAFDDEYFRHMQWAHFASGGAGGGMRWPNRHPHVLTQGMRRAQQSLADFTSLIDWTCFNRRNLNEEAWTNHPALQLFACGDSKQALAWLLRQDTLNKDGTLRRDAAAITPVIFIPDIEAGTYTLTVWDTQEGKPMHRTTLEHAKTGELAVEAGPIVNDAALAIRQVH